MCHQNQPFIEVSHINDFIDMLAYDYANLQVGYFGELEQDELYSWYEVNKLFKDGLCTMLEHTKGILLLISKYFNNNNVLQIIDMYVKSVYDSDKLSLKQENKLDDTWGYKIVG